MYGGPGRDRTDEPPACKTGALPTELQARKNGRGGRIRTAGDDKCHCIPNAARYQATVYTPSVLVAGAGFEPTTSSL